MAWIMSMIGLILVAAGCWWVGALLLQYDANRSTMAAVATMYVALPGLSTLGSGLVFMAIGAGLFRLAQIHDEAKHIADQIDRLIAARSGD